MRRGERADETHSNEILLRVNNPETPFILTEKKKKKKIPSPSDSW